MAQQTPLVLISGAFSTLFPGDTVGPATDSAAQASGNAALVLANTALASGNAGIAGAIAAISIGLTAQASGNAGISTGLNAQASGNAALVLANTALASGNAGISTGLTALASGNAALSLANLKLPLSGGVLTGDVILDNQVDARFREATASGVNYVGFQAPANIVSDIIFTLPSVDGTNGQALVTNGSSVLSFATIASIPAGVITWYAANTAPTGFLKANGALISRTTYASLFVAISTTFGVGDGSTTFGLPDLRGEFARGWDDSRGVDTGRVFGSTQAQDLQPHVHTATVLSSNSQSGGFGNLAAGGDTGSFGTTETRPRNIALLAIIKF